MEYLIKLVQLKHTENYYAKNNSFGKAFLKRLEDKVGNSFKVRRFSNEMYYIISMSMLVHVDDCIELEDE
jgi:hypothetical protein